jgi:hypothetical protein
MPLYVPAPDLTPWGTHDCRLEWNSATTIRLVRYGGSTIMIKGVRQVIPAGGIVAATPLTDAAYLVYAYMSGSTMLLAFEPVASGFATDAYGMPAVGGGGLGNPLVGLIWAQAAGIDGPRLVCSYWNRILREIIASGSLNSGSTTPIYFESLRIYFVCFDQDSIDAHYSGTVYPLTVAQAVQATAIALDNGTPPGPDTISQGQLVNAQVATGVRVQRRVTGHGIHSIVPRISINAGTGWWVFNGGARYMA